MHAARRISEALGSWLHYENCCFRKELFSESSFKAAVGDVLSSFPGSVPRTRVHAEFPHLALNPNGGSLLRADFALIPDANVAARTGADILVEAKWANSSHCTPTNMFKDILRLAVMKEVDPGAVCIFLLAGGAKQVRAILSAPPFNVLVAQQLNDGVGRRKHKKLHMKSNIIPHRQAFGSAITLLRDLGYSLPQSFECSYYGLHPAQPVRSPRSSVVDYQAVAWEISNPSVVRLNSLYW
ncbi:hypothetical protein [Stenotrophomonas indicatrix]|uniref:Uncharacterized protein n=1 Tax=Stenotrophomonas indicatrix TaxID=2045451 RepID=A0A1W1GX57_9GAMM|nr:hypothetical protein [Stenotrophomonas indicatrix]SLM23932.1 hypothetical protein SAMN04488690_1639 [Stenotrophomonas indicatrix]